MERDKKTLSQHVFADILCGVVGNPFSLYKTKKWDYQQPYAKTFARKHLSSELQQALDNDTAPQREVIDLGKLYGSIRIEPLLLNIKHDVQQLVNAWLEDDPVQIIALYHAMSVGKRVVNGDKYAAADLAEDYVAQIKKLVTPATRYVVVEVHRFLVENPSDRLLILDNAKGRQLAADQLTGKEIINTLQTLIAKFAWHGMYNEATTMRKNSTKLETGFFTVDQCIVDQLNNIQDTWQQAVKAFFAEYDVEWQVQT